MSPKKYFNMKDSTKVDVLVEPSKRMIKRILGMFSKFHIRLPPVYSSLSRFLKMRSRESKNPCPPEVGLRFARPMDMISVSAARGKPATKE